MSKPKILIISRSFGVYCEEALKILNRFAYIERKRITSKEEMKEVVNNYDGVVLGNERMDKEILLSANRLKIVARHGVGVDNIDLEASTQKGIVVTYTPHANSDSVAEYAITLMLNIIKNLQKAHNETVKGNWKRFLGFELMNKTIGIVGFGGIGKKVAKKLAGFDVKILAYDPYVSDEEVKKNGAIPVSLDELLKSSDIVTLHVALTTETRHLINKDRLRLMKKESFLINTSRGAVVDEKALYDVLKNREIAGAALDVFEKEPISKDNPLLSLDNIIVSPHMANFTIEALRRMDMMNAEDLKRFFKGERPLHVANPEVYKR
jgi:D-3-phosphoglycerate dehydrogenase